MTEKTATIGAAKRWIRFLIGVLLLASCVGFFASGYSPPGIFGEVLRHNQQHDIDASPLFYTEVEHMHDLESSLSKPPTDGK